MFNMNHCSILGCLLFFCRFPPLLQLIFPFSLNVSCVLYNKPIHFGSINKPTYLPTKHELCECLCRTHLTFHQSAGPLLKLVSSTCPKVVVDTHEPVDTHHHQFVDRSTWTLSVTCMSIASPVLVSTKNRLCSSDADRTIGKMCMLLSTVLRWCWRRAKATNSKCFNGATDNLQCVIVGVNCLAIIVTLRWFFITIQSHPSFRFIIAFMCMIMGNLWMNEWMSIHIYMSQHPHL